MDCFNYLRYTENISDDVDIFGNTSRIWVKGEVACILIIDFWIILNNACTRWPCNCHWGIVTFQLRDMWDIVQCQILFSDITIERDFFIRKCSNKGLCRVMHSYGYKYFCVIMSIRFNTCPSFPITFHTKKVNYLFFS